MSDRKIKITVNQLGEPTVEAIGFNGIGCAEATSNIEKALAGSDAPTTRVLKPEWHNTEEETEHNHMTW